MDGGRDVLVTGVGLVGPYGSSADDTFQALIEGRSAIRTLEHLRRLGCPSFVGAAVSSDEWTQHLADRRSRRQLRTMDPVHQWALVAAVLALRDAGLATINEGGLALEEPVANAAVAVGTGLSGRHAMEQTLTRSLAGMRSMGDSADDDPEGAIRLMTAITQRDVNPVSFLQQCPSMAASHIAIRLGSSGPNLTTMSLCAAGAQAIGEAARLVSSGAVDLAIAGGADSMLHPIDITAFYALGAISSANDDGPAACKPFDLRRDGTVLGEGAAFLVLESESHAHRRGVYGRAEVAGYGTTHDAHALSAPHPEGAGAAAAMRTALAGSGVSPDGVALINAHATGTLLNDPIEAKAIKDVFGMRACKIPVVSTKSLIGHWIAAAGAVEAIVSILSLQRGMTHATANLLDPDPRCDLDLVTSQPRLIERGAVLSNSFAIGGVNASLVFRPTRSTDG